MRNWLRFYRILLNIGIIVLVFILPNNLSLGMDLKKYESCGQAYQPGLYEGDNGILSLKVLRLVGGSESAAHAWPWNAEILYASGGHKCGGALIDRDVVVSAAHCFPNKRNDNKLKLMLGGVRSRSGDEHKIVEVIVHPKFDPISQSYDIAILKFKPPVEFSASVRRICLPQKPISTNKKCVVTGWGREKERGRGSSTLKEILVPIVDFVICNDKWHYNGRLNENTMMCAGYEEGKIDACQGDSGGPLFCLVDDRWELHGVVSWGDGCARPRKFGIYSKVQNFVSWIQSELCSTTSPSLIC